MRKLAIDLGTVTCGLAISDPLNMFAIGLDVLRYQECDFNYLLEEISRYVVEYNVDTIILGYPLRMTNTKSDTTIYVENFYELLKLKFDLKIILEDERETTKEALSILKKGNLARKKQKKYKDSLAAQIILERYLGV
ncbi:Holliday junction resolvase RuvX [Mycoplasma elephantis]|uniref:Holliday junction resolvase RuvX n=1 Tax=Mycoplasma elephantis TaxID=114882 RepID=UPI00047FB68B|nr:Holliday junction resolvase RuvX [Mycoplasma elephantis]